MNGVSLLLTLASLSVVYSWRTGIDQQQEYVLQIEPEVVQALSAGEEIFSDVPAEAGPFQRLCLVVLPKDGTAARHTAAGEDQFRQLLISAGRYASRDRGTLSTDSPPAILWPARVGASPEQSFGATTGWQPDTAGNQQYIIQIDPTVLSTLALGDELYVPIDPAAGRLTRFVVKVGREQLPRVGGSQPLGAPQLGVQPPTTLQSPGATPFGPPRNRYNTAADNAAGWNSQATRPTGGYGEGAPPLGPVAPTGGFNAPAQNYGPPPPLNPAANSTYPNYNQPQQPQTASGFDSFGNPRPNTEMFSPQNFGVQPVANQPPQLPPQRPYMPQYPEARVAGLPPSPGMPSTAPAFGMTQTQSGLGMQPQQDKPWGPFLFVTFALFFSIGGNLYLAYTALEYHNRYRSAIERLRSAARSP